MPISAKLFGLLMMVVLGDLPANSTRCMLRCAPINCKKPEVFLWCSTQCGSHLSYRDVQNCAAHFDAKVKARQSTCAATLEGAFGALPGVHLFCETIRDLLLSERSEGGFVIMELLVSAIHNVKELGRMQEAFLKRSKKEMSDSSSNQTANG